MKVYWTVFYGGGRVVREAVVDSFRKRLTVF